MKEDEKQIKKLKKQIDELMPEYNKKKKEYDLTSKAYWDVERRLDELMRKIATLTKKIRVETFKKSVGKGELLSFRSFFDEIRSKRDFTGKTLVWSFKNGKSGMFVNLWVNNTAVSKKLLDSYHKRYIYNPDTVISLVRDFSTWRLDDFMFDAFTVGSMVDGRRYYDMKLDDVFVFICDAKTLDDFDDVADTEGLYFFDHLPYVYKSPGKTHKIGSDGLDYLSLGCSGIPKSHYKSYKLYPLKTIECGGGWSR